MAKTKFTEKKLAPHRKHLDYLDAYDFEHILDNDVFKIYQKKLNNTMYCIAYFWLCYGNICNIDLFLCSNIMDIESQDMKIHEEIIPFYYDNIEHSNQLKSWINKYRITKES